MKIGIDISQIVFTGGVPTYTSNLVRSLLSIDTRNDYILFGASLGRWSKLSQRTQILQRRNAIKKLFPFRPSWLDYMWNKKHIMPVELFTGPLDVFHASDWTQPPTRAAKKITTIHDLAIFTQSAHTPEKIISVHKRRLTWVAKECDAIIADSESTKKDIQKYLSIPAEKIHVIYLGVDEQFVPQKSKAIDTMKKKYAINTDYMLAFGAPGYRKNIQGLITAFRKIAKDIPHSLVIIGDMPRGVQIDDRILHIPVVPWSELPVWYTGASMFVYPSFYEGFGLPVLEAMACGCPVICSNKGSLAEIAGNSMIIDPESSTDIAQKMSDVLHFSDTQYARHVADGIKHTKKFTWEKTARKTLAIYQKVSGSHRV